MKITFQGHLYSNEKNTVTVEFDGIEPVCFTGYEHVRVVTRSGDERDLNRAERLAFETALDDMGNKLLANALAEYIIGRDV